MELADSARPHAVQVLGTAVSYMKRMYLTFSSLDQDPQHMVLTCLYLACKARKKGAVAWFTGAWRS